MGREHRSISQANRAGSDAQPVPIFEGIILRDHGLTGGIAAQDQARTRLAQNSSQSLGRTGGFPIDQRGHRNCYGVLSFLGLHDALSPIQQWPLLLKKQTGRSRRRRVIISLGETQIQDQPIQFVGRGNQRNGILEGFREALLDTRNAQVGYLSLKQRRPADQGGVGGCAYISFTRDQGDTGMEAGQQALHSKTVQINLAHASEVFLYYVIHLVEIRGRRRLWLGMQTHGAESEQSP